MNYTVIRTNEFLQHHGILGMHWGIRRFQNKDGSLTNAGRDRYGVGDERESSEEETSKQKKGLKLTEGQKKAIKIGATIVAGTLVAYGGYKLAQKTGLLKKYKNIDVGDLLGNSDELEKATKIGSLADKLGKPVNMNFKLTSETVKNTVSNTNPSCSMDNCGACVTASLLNDCGFNVQAVEHIPSYLTNGGRGLDPKKIQQIWKGVGELNVLDDIEGNRKQVVERLINQLNNTVEPGGAGRIFIMDSKRKYRDAVESFEKLSPEIRNSVPQNVLDRYNNAKDILSGKKNPPGHYFEYFKDVDGRIGFKDGQPKGGLVHYDIEDIITQWFSAGTTDISTVRWTNDIVNGVKNGTIKPDVELIKGLLASF